MDRSTPIVKPIAMHLTTPLTAATGRDAVFALIPCGGTGSRAGAGLPKQYRQLAGDTVLGHTMRAFTSAAQVPPPDGLAGLLQRVVVVVSPGDPHLAAAQASLAPGGYSMVVSSVAARAGATRADTVLNGLGWLLDNGAQPNDWVLVHDAARCLVTPAQINALVSACLGGVVGGLLAHPLADTLKQADPGSPGQVSATLDRSHKWLAQTPQMFRAGALHAALQAKAADSFDGITDEASAMEMAGFAPKLVVGSPHNFKVTYPPDFALAEDLLGSRK